MTDAAPSPASRERATTAAILAIGDEIVRGESLDTNSGWLARRLAEMGVAVRECATVSDDRDAIAHALRRLASPAHVVITTGGLGPTLDDLTRESLADALGETLVEDAAALRDIEARFASLGVTMRPTNRRQALRPASATLIPNPNGSAPGIEAALARSDAGNEPTRIWCLPGPPGEMQPMFEAHVAPALAAMARDSRAFVLRTRLVRVFGMGESEVAQRLGELMQRSRNPCVGTTAHAGFVTCRIRFVGDARDADSSLRDAARAVRERLDARVFGEDDDTLEGATLDALRSRGERLVTVESCTGGMLGAMLTRVAGASDVYVGGWITYANEMKLREVGVRDGTLAAHGAVSPQTATQMAEGALTRAPEASVAVSITGVAGPGGGTADKPVGLIYIGVAQRERGGVGDRAAGEGDFSTRVRCFRFPGERQRVRESAAATALALLRLRALGEQAPTMLWEQAMH